MTRCGVLSKPRTASHDGDRDRHDCQAERHAAFQRTRGGTRPRHPARSVPAASTPPSRRPARPARQAPIRFHNLRHTYASLLIAQGVNVAFVSRQLGHATPATPLHIYAHLFDEAANLGRAREYVNGQFANLTSPR